MDIKQEPVEIIDSVAENGTEWQKYKMEFNFDDIKLKMDKYVSENSTNVDEKWTGRPNNGNTDTSQICSHNVSARHFEIIDVKKEPADSREVSTNESMEYSNNCRLRSSCQYPGSIPRILLHRVPSYRRYFVCNVCQHVSPTADEQRLHFHHHERSVFHSPGGQLASQDNIDMVSVNSSITSTAPAPLFKVHIAEFPVKKKLVGSESVNFTDSSKCGNKIHLKKKPFKCNECDFSCQRSGDLRRHKLIHSGVKPFKCDKCHYSCIRSNQLKLHNMIHSGEKPFKCDKCEYFCVKSSDIKRHKLIHSGEKPFKCEQCEYTCSRLDYLKLHHMIHSGEKRFKCDQCVYSCIQPSQMKVHKMIHSDTDPLKCDQCKFSSKITYLLKRHKLIHSGEKSFKCEKCDYICRESTDLKKHMMIHSTKKPFKCEQCNYSCICLKYLKKHKKVHT